MKFIYWCLQINAFVFIFGALENQALAQASLAAENVITDAKTTLNGKEESYTLFRDARNEEQWYYVPNKPTLSTITKTDGVIEPEFSLVRYQYRDPKDSAKLVEEGIVQFGASLGAPPSALEDFKKAIEATGKAASRISAIPFKSAEVSLYSYAPSGQKSNLVANAPYGSGLAPLFASQNMVFSIPLTRIGSDVIDKLVSGNTGIPVAVTFTFNALTPPAGFKVKVDYDQLFEHYSKDQKFAASASWFGWYGASAQYSSQQIRESLINNKDIEVQLITGENFTMADVDKFLQPILARINLELIEAVKPPPEIQPAAASEPSSRGGWFGSAGYSVAIKDVRKVKKGSETWDMRVQQIVERKSIAQGFIGIGSYSEEIIKRVVTVVPTNTFKSAYLMIPSPAVASEAGITNIDLEVALMQESNVVDSRVLQWQTGAVGWKDISGTDQRVVAFPLLELAARDPNFKNSSFITKFKLTTLNQYLETTNQTPAFNGQQAMPGANGALYDIIEIGIDQLQFAGISNKAITVLQGNASILINGKNFDRSIRIKQVDTQKFAPDPIRILALAGKSPTKASAKISFQLSNGKSAEWKYNGKDLRETFNGLSISITDNDLIEK